LKNARLLKFPSSFAVRIPGTRSDPFGLPEHVPDASRFRISGALHPDIFEQPAKGKRSPGLHEMDIKKPPGKQFFCIFF
jgi:hypothetical protein